MNKIIEDFEIRWLEMESNYRHKFLPGTERVIKVFMGLITRKDIADALSTRYGVHRVGITTIGNDIVIKIYTRHRLRITLRGDMYTLIMAFLKPYMMVSITYDVFIVNPPFIRDYVMGIDVAKGNGTDASVETSWRIKDGIAEIVNQSCQTGRLPGGAESNSPKDILEAYYSGTYLVEEKLHKPCCANESRSMAGGCKNCGDPSF